MFDKSYVRNLGPPDWLVFFAIVVIGIAAIAIKQTNRPQGDVTGTVSQTEPPAKHDGTAAHPYPDASQCPPEPIWFFGQAVARSRASLRACRSALLEISRLRIAVRIV
jgi:hypothetical protein